MSHLSHIQTPEPPSPEPPEPYATLRDDELVDAETLIAELDATEPTPELKKSETNLSQTEKYVDTEQWLDELCAELTANQPEPTDEPVTLVTLVTLRSETSPIKSDTAEVFDQRVTNVTNVTPPPVNTPSDIGVALEKSERDLQQSEKFVDTEAFLDELCAELTANQPEPTETEPTDLEVLVWQCERCGRVFERLIEADLFGSPKCRVCGGTLKIRWQRSDKQ